MIRKLAYGASAAVLMMSAASAVYAQETTGGIRGRVLDDAGSPVAGASVTVVHVPTGTSSTAVTSSDGSYSARNLRVGGPYEVTVAANGYASEPTGIAAIGIGNPATVDVYVSDLSAATNVEELIVTGTRAGPLRTSPRTQFGLSDIETLPSIGRDIKDFVRTSPFATTDPTNQDALSIGGQSTRFNAFLVDGVRQGDDFGLNANGYPTVRTPISISVLEAVTVEVAPYDVQYGSFTGGVINSVTKSGTNDFHGEAFWETTGSDYQGDSYSYEDFITGNRIDRQVTAEFEETSYGATLSGPIIPDTLFFLVNYEYFEGTQPVLSGPAGSGSTIEIPNISQADVDNIRSITQSVYGYDPLGATTNSLALIDEKYFAKLDWNINDRHRAVFSYQQTENSDPRLGSFSTQTSYPILPLLSQSYTLTTNLTAYKAQLFSDWTDTFSTEFSISRKEVESLSSTPADNQFAQFTVYLDAPGAQRRAIRLGTDISRQANVLTNDLDQIRFVGNWDAGDGQQITFGIERETVEVFNLFVQRAAGEYEFASISDYQARQASYIRYANAASNDENDAAAAFSYSLNSLFFQDEWSVTPELTVSAGFRYDWYETDDAPRANPLIASTYGIASNNTIDGVSVFQPRLGFNWRPDETLTVYGGIGRFQGGSPNVWIANNYTNTGNSIGDFNCRRAGYTSQNINSQTVCNATLLPSLNNVDGFNPNPAAETAVTNSANLGTGVVNLIDPAFEAPSIWKASLGVSKEFDFSRFGLGEGWVVRAEYVHSELENSVGWKDLRDQVRATATMPDGRPRYVGTPGNPVLMLTNFDGGTTDQVAISLGKDWYDGLLDGLGFNLSYTYLDSTDIHAGTSSVAASNYNNLATFDSNNPEVSDSNYEIEDAIKLNVSYSRAFFGDYQTRFNLFGQRRSGLNYSYTFGVSTATLTGENGAYSAQRQLLYVPNVDTSGNVTLTSDPIVRYGPGFDIAGFNTFLRSTGLIDSAGQITKRNAYQSPDITTFDLSVSQELPAFFPGGAKLELYADIENFGNLLNDEWGVLQQVGFPYFSNNVVALNCQVSTACVGGVAGQGNFYQYNSFADRSASVPSNVPVWQIKVGVRYTF
ncbi:TonB-dependent receptor [Brevundimonas sp.]|uniref:TonB-dependent receptor n=1 Tax=Brevundimonas sp. TaxID=1871086 RepID=UPI002ABB013A|nr:TonB-dependent receptor [Brevundimonas sp.]MDZ4363703.1 TonB-dependent receptor [Brevundimonas sp.]